jgi:hypothetical protein
MMVKRWFKESREYNASEGINRQKQWKSARGCILMGRKDTRGLNKVIIDPHRQASLITGENGPNHQRIILRISP